MPPKRRISWSTILTLALTASVIVGCVLVFGTMVDADSLTSAVEPVRIGVNAATAEPAKTPHSTVKTTVVTIAPSDLAPVVTQTPVPGQEIALSMTVGGLVKFNSDISDAAYDAASQTFDYTPLFEHLLTEIHADMNFVTLENILTVNTRQYADVTVPSQAILSLKTAGFDRILLNTRYILDQGRAGLDTTVDEVGRAGMTPQGIAADGDAISYFTINSVKIALISYVEGLTGKGRTALEGECAGMLTLYDLLTARDDIERARREGAGLVIVAINWGAETDGETSANERDIARGLAQFGADIILGANPQKVFKPEWITTTDADGVERKTLAAYSMGTLLCESRDAYDIAGMLLHVRLSYHTGTGRISFLSTEYTPTYIWRQVNGSKTIFRVLNAALQPSEGMSQKQVEVMQRSLNRIREIMAGGAATERAAR